MATASIWTELKGSWQRFAGLTRSFWQWWWQELTGMLPERWRYRFSDHGTRLLIDIADQQCNIRFGTERQASDSLSFQFTPDSLPPGVIVEKLRRLKGEAKEIILQIPMEQVLSRTISLPLATEKNLAGVLRFEMDRHTPFTADQVYFASQLEKRDPANQKILVRLFLVTREAVDPLLSRLNALGLQPSVLRPSVSEDADELNLLPEHARPSESGRQWLGRRLKALTLLIAVALLGWFPLHLKEQQAADLTQRIEEPKALAAEAKALAEQVSQLEQMRQQMLLRQAEAPLLLLLLQELTRLLPDNTWISRFDLQKDKLRLDGESGDASSLIGLLEQSGFLDNVSFASPVTANPRTGKDRFSISAQLREPPNNPVSEDDS
ncbi:PilN domain-containing protein [Marinobacterium arenosum]|uniref:PilN domain-containing protein n=1 Tax=Marinobacterium arenosum TaxID=2862496 RepID=UPI001C9710A1|nr:PilN domain-containing protein [Marinobacterium arenosum]MBY4678555.1 PilN domain-containing protein [Marinobacterium arenosum]